MHPLTISQGSRSISGRLSTCFRLNIGRVHSAVGSLHLKHWGGGQAHPMIDASATAPFSHTATFRSNANKLILYAHGAGSKAPPANSVCTLRQILYRHSACWATCAVLAKTRDSDATSGDTDFLIRCLVCSCMLNR